MTLSELLSRSLVLLSGKGGVGKTTVAISLALLAAKKNKRVLIVEMNSTDRIATYFGEKPIGHNETIISPNVSVINLCPQKCFEEYVARQVPFKPIVDVFVKSKYVTHFLGAVPGFNELLMMGKIIDYIQKNERDAEASYDMVIVDGPATGHGVSAFEIPKVVHDMVSTGPLRKQSEKMLKVLEDHDKTVFSVVSLAEEMPVNETTELISIFKEKLNIGLGPAFMNQVHEIPLTQSEDKKIKNFFSDSESRKIYKKIIDFSLSRAELNQRYLKIFKKLNSGVETIILPELDKPIDNKNDFSLLVDQLEACVS